jgi:hypothetical protein
MPDSDISYEDLRERAKHCEQLALKTNNPSVADSFRKLAEQWRRSAEAHRNNEMLLRREAALLKVRLPS